MAPFEALNAEIAASPVREGDRLVVDNIEIRFSFAEGRGRAILTTNGVVLEETGEGTVRVQYPAETKSIARLEFDGAEGAPEAIVLTSANRSDEPICFTTEDAANTASRVAVSAARNGIVVSSAEPGSSRSRRSERMCSIRIIFFLSPTEFPTQDLICTVKYWLNGRLKIST